MKTLTPSLILMGLALTMIFAGYVQAAAADGLRLTGEAAPPADPLSLWYRRPARQWVEALAIGNGRLGAMVFGGIDNERIQLNEGTLWAGGPYDPVNPEALARCRSAPADL